MSFQLYVRRPSEHQLNQGGWLEVHAFDAQAEHKELQRNLARFRRRLEKHLGRKVRKWQNRLIIDGTDFVRKNGTWHFRATSGPTRPEIQSVIDTFLQGS